MVIEGHSDNVPIKTKKFRNNWELSSARATNIATMLIEKINKTSAPNFCTRRNISVNVFTSISDMLKRI